MSQLHALRAGQGPTLLLLHGIGSSCTAWSAQIERLAGDFSCIAPDLPGYGDSPELRGEGLRAIVDEVAALLDGEPAHVLGVSFGALTCIGLAHFRPELVSSLVLSDATLGRGYFPPDERARWLQGRRRLADELATRSAERAAEIASPQAPQQVIDEIAAHMRRARPEGYMAVARAIAETDARPWLERIDRPALVICGEDDRVTGLDVSRLLTQQLRDSRMCTIAGAGHAPHIEQPEQFAQAVRGFLLGADR